MGFIAAREEVASRKAAAKAATPDSGDPSG
jgi:hypothetical protein